MSDSKEYVLREVRNGLYVTKINVLGHGYWAISEASNSAQRAIRMCRSEAESMCAAIMELEHPMFYVEAVELAVVIQSKKGGEK